MTVSSTSETTPKRTSGPDDEHARLDGLAALDRHRERLPSRLEPAGDDACRSRRRGRRRPRASTPPIVIRTWAKPTGTAAKLRQPRTLAYSPEPGCGHGRDDEHAPEDPHPVGAAVAGERGRPSGSGRARARGARATRGTGTRAGRATALSGARAASWWGASASVFHVLRGATDPGVTSGQLVVAVQVLALGPLDDLLARRRRAGGRRTMMPTKM